MNKHERIYRSARTLAFICWSTWAFTLWRMESWGGDWKDAGRILFVLTAAIAVFAGTAVFCCAATDHGIDKHDEEAK